MITKTIWTCQNDSTKAYDEYGDITDPRLIGCVMSIDEPDITVTKTGESDGFTIYSITADELIWEYWEDVLENEGYL